MRKLQEMWNIYYTVNRTFQIICPIMFKSNFEKPLSSDKFTAKVLPRVIFLLKPFQNVQRIFKYNC